MPVVRTGLVPGEDTLQLRECGISLRRLAQRLLQPAVLPRPAPKGTTVKLQLK